MEKPSKFTAEESRQSIAVHFESVPPQVGIGVSLPDPTVPDSAVPESALDEGPTDQAGSDREP
jgi:hypothetical protein